MNSRNPHQVSPPQRTPTTNIGAPTRRPTAEQWHRAASVLPDTPLPLPPKPAPQRQRPTPPENQPGGQHLPRRPRPRLTRLGYWLSILFIAFFAFVLHYSISGTEEPTLNLITGLLSTALYLPVATLRLRDMGLPWWVCFTTLIPFIGFFAALWLGIAKPSIKFAEEATTAEQPPKPPGQMATAKATITTLLHRLPVKFQASKKHIIIGASISVLLVAAVITTLAVALTEDGPDRVTLTKCDNELRTQLNSPELTPGVPNAKAAVKAIQEQRIESCRADFWNPLVTDIASDHLGNIDITFSTRPGNANGAAVTTPADGNQRWVYLAEENQWYSAKIGDPSRLATTPPTARPTTRQTQVARPTPSWHTPPPTRPAQPPATVIVNAFRNFDYIGNEIFTGKALAEFDRGEDLYLQGEYRAAILTYQLAQKHRNEPSRTIENRIGMSLQALGNHQQAVLHFTKALDIQDNPIDRVNRAISYFETGQCPLTIQDAQQALEMEHIVSEVYHSDAEAHAILAACHISENPQRAIEHAQKALNLAKSTGYPAEELASLHMAIGAAHYLLDSYSEAIRHYSHAITLDDNAEARSSRARAYWSTEDCTSAIEDSLEATAMLPVTSPGYHTEAEAHIVLLFCFSEQEKWSEALPHAEAALVLMHANNYDPEYIELVADNVLFLRRTTR